MIVTLVYLKDYLGADLIGSTSDPILTDLIEGAEADYLDIRNAPFKTDDNDNIEYPNGSMSVASSMVGFTLSAKEDNGRVVASEKNLSYSVSFSDSSTTLNGYPLSIVGRIKKYVRGM